MHNLLLIFISAFYSQVLLFNIILNKTKISTIAYNNNNNLIKNSQAVKKGAAPKKVMVKKDFVKSKVAAKKWL